MKTNDKTKNSSPKNVNKQKTDPKSSKTYLLSTHSTIICKYIQNNF